MHLMRRTTGAGLEYHSQRDELYRDLQEFEEGFRVAAGMGVSPPHRGGPVLLLSGPSRRLPTRRSAIHTNGRHPAGTLPANVARWEN
jgi:hypothetical protein